MRHWVAFAVAFGLAASVALGIGYWMQQRNSPDPRVWLDSGGTLEMRGSQFSVASFGRFEGDLPEFAQLPNGAVVTQLELQQLVVTAPVNPQQLACEITLHTEQASWEVDWTITTGLEVNYDCVPLEGVDSQTITVLVVVPPEVLEQEPWAQVSFYEPPGVFGVRP